MRRRRIRRRASNAPATYLPQSPEPTQRAAARPDDWLADEELLVQRFFRPVKPQRPAIVRTTR